ncbi:hypothetical protein KUCAC02_012181 [Chaenocephalus aceratus]|uniref:Uncharacterized protein n=1 Tax=Chaenocephalus aceratus TaxID=36190 RepID=A0ACB9XAX8_CHAAC|nr:hypothetical protein KUCAC02_012181 [Chaenocephalus aceratus]
MRFWSQWRSQNLGPNSILQDDNARPHRARIITEYFQNLGVERMERPAVIPDLKPTLVGSAWACCTCQRDQRNHVADLRQILVEEWDASV